MGKTPVVIVVVLVGVFSQSCLFESNRKLCKLANILVGKLYNLLMWWWVVGGGDGGVVVVVVPEMHGHGRDKHLGMCLVLESCVSCVMSL